MPAAVSSGKIAPAWVSEPTTVKPAARAKSANGPRPVPEMPEK